MATLRLVSELDDVGKLAFHAAKVEQAANQSHENDS
jgi:hypothetical protein